ncbi:MAG: hypothetical protein AAGE80_06620 [Pseudomonadota bacterium]
MANETSLDHLDFDRSTESREGIDLSHIARLRVQYLTAQSNALITQTQFADAKAAALMTLSGLLFFRGPAGISFDLTTQPLLLAALALNASCVIACIWTLIPRVRREARVPGLYESERFSWVALSDKAAEEEDFANFMRTAQASQLILSQARANQAVAKVLRRKFQVLRSAFLLGAASVAAIALHWLIGGL